MLMQLEQSKQKMMLDHDIKQKEVAIKDRSKIFWGQNLKDERRTVIKSVYRKPNREIKELDIRGILDGRTHSSSAPRYQNVNNHIQITRPAVARFSALQNTTDNNVTSLTGDVNRTIEDLIEKLSQERRGW